MPESGARSVRLSVYAGRRPEVITARQDLEGLSFYHPSPVIHVFVMYVCVARGGGVGVGGACLWVCVMK